MHYSFFNILHYSNSKSSFSIFRKHENKVKSKLYNDISNDFMSKTLSNSKSLMIKFWAWRFHWDLICQWRGSIFPSQTFSEVSNKMLHYTILSKFCDITVIVPLSPVALVWSELPPQGSPWVDLVNITLHCGMIWTGKTSNTDTFYEVLTSLEMQFLVMWLRKISVNDTCQDNFSKNSWLKVPLLSNLDYHNSR